MLRSQRNAPTTSWAQRGKRTPGERGEADRVRHEGAARELGSGTVLGCTPHQQQTSRQHAPHERDLNMPHRTHAPRHSIAILLVMLGLLASLGHAAETF